MIRSELELQGAKAKIFEKNVSKLLDSQGPNPHLRIRTLIFSVRAQTIRTLTAKILKFGYRSRP